MQIISRVWNYRFRQIFAFLLVFLVLSVNTPSATATAHYFQVKNHRLFFEVKGQGSPVVFLHGGGSNGRDSFSHQIDAFSQHHKVILIDQVDHGRSSSSDDPLSYRIMMEDTYALLKDMGESRYDLVGWSDGAIIALMLSAYHPDMVRRLVVSGANISPDGLTEQSLQSLRRDADPAFLRALEADLAGGEDEDNNDVTTALTDADVTDDADSVSSPEALAATLAESEHPFDLGEKLRQLWLTSPTVDQLNTGLLHGIDKPVLVMAGDHDEIRLEHSLMIYHALPQAQLWIVPGTGHAVLNQRPDWFNSVVLSFLEQ